MGWTNIIGSVTEKAASAYDFGKGVVQGAKEGAVSLASGLKGLAVGSWKVATDPQAREEFLQQATHAAQRAADYGGRLINDPASRHEAWEKVQSFVGAAKERYIAERDLAQKEGRLDEFYGRIAGRAGFEVGAVVVPATKLGLLGKGASGTEVAADLSRATAIGAQLPKARAGEVVVACAQDVVTANAMARATTSAAAAADVALAAGRASGATSELRIGSRVFVDISTGGAERTLHPAVRAALEEVPLASRAPWHGYCAEMGALSQALEAGVSPAGGVSRAVNIGKSGAGHGTLKATCSSCKVVLDKFGVIHD